MLFEHNPGYFDANEIFLYIRPLTQKEFPFRFHKNTYTRYSLKCNRCFYISRHFPFTFLLTAVSRKVVTIST